jgi:ClpP class serine protease
LIAPYAGVRISPIEERSAQISISEEFGVETAINEIKSRTDVKKLLLLLNSPGGLVQSSYKVARALRQSFDGIIVFVPHLAVSGGTLVALAGNEIVMGMMSQLGPLDVQVGDKSTQSVIRGFENVTDLFRKLLPEEAPYTYRALAEKFDPVEMDECNIDK